MAKTINKTYSIAAFNQKENMNEMLPYVFKAKYRAIDVAKQMIAFGAKNVRVICNQTKEEIYI